MGRLHYTRRHPQPAPQYKKSYYPLCPTGKAPNCYLYTLCPNLTDPPNLLYINRYLCRPVSRSCSALLLSRFSIQNLGSSTAVHTASLTYLNAPLPLAHSYLTALSSPPPYTHKHAHKKRSDLEDLTLKRRLPTLPQLVQYHRRL